MAMHEASVPKEEERRGRKKLHHLRVHPVDGGGHLITHHAASEYGHEEKPYRTHVFGKEEGSAAADHVAKHAKFHPPKDESETVKRMEVSEEDGEEE